MIDVTRQIRSPAAVDRPFFVHAEKVFAAALLNFLIQNQRPKIFDEPLALGNWFRGKQTKPGLSSFHSERGVPGHTSNVTTSDCTSVALSSQISLLRYSFCAGVRAEGCAGLYLGYNGLHEQRCRILLKATHHRLSGRVSRGHRSLQRGRVSRGA